MKLTRRVHMSSSSNADFNGFDTLTLTISSATQTQKTLARYTKDPARLPGKTIGAPAVEDVELLDYYWPGRQQQDDHAGRIGQRHPSRSSWTADVDLDVRSR